MCPKINFFFFLISVIFKFRRVVKEVIEYEFGYDRIVKNDIIQVIEYDFGYDRIVKNNTCDCLCCCIFGLGPRRSIML